MNTMKVTAVQTPLFHRGDHLVNFIVTSVPSNLVQERMVLAITTKIVSLAQDRLLPKNSIDKKTLCAQESEIFLGEIGYQVSLGIKHSLLLPGAGVDESNSEHGDYILHPLNPMETATTLREELRKLWALRELGIILTDSRSGPLRLGTTGVAIACAGFYPVLDKAGHKDLFGRPLKVTKVNVADSLAAAAVLTMGEADESCPLAIIHESQAVFTESFALNTWQLSPDADMYLPLYKHLMKS